MNVNGMLMTTCEGHAHEGECDGLAQEAYEADEDCDWHDNHCDAVVACETLNQELCALQHGCEWHADDNACEAEVQCSYPIRGACMCWRSIIVNGMLMIMHV